MCMCMCEFGCVILSSVRIVVVMFVCVFHNMKLTQFFRTKTAMPPYPLPFAFLGTQGRLLG